MEKIKISKKEFDDIYQIVEITGDTKANPETHETQPEIPEEDTTPFLTEEQEEQDAKLFEDLPMEDSE